jgi:hypothetical protein
MPFYVKGFQVATCKLYCTKPHISKPLMSHVTMSIYKLVYNKRRRRKKPPEFVSYVPNTSTLNKEVDVDVDVD